jgi:hypothetical protein
MMFSPGAFAVMGMAVTVTADTGMEPRA